MKDDIVKLKLAGCEPALARVVPWPVMFITTQ